MIVLLDHNVPRQLRLKIGSHLVLTARQKGWDLLANGNLMRAAESEGFEVMITTDKDFLDHRDNPERKIAIVLVSTNHWPSLDSAHEEIRAAVEASSPGSFIDVPVKRLTK